MDSEMRIPQTKTDPALSARIRASAERVKNMPVRERVSMIAMQDLARITVHRSLTYSPEEYRAFLGNLLRAAEDDEDALCAIGDTTAEKLFLSTEKDRRRFREDVRKELADLSN